MALAPNVTQAVAQSLLTAFETAANAGTAAVIRGLTGGVPTDSDTAESGTLLFTLTASAAIFTTKTDGAPGAVGTFDTITQDSSADNTGTLTYWRLLTQTGGTVIMQGTAGTATTDMIINTTAITSGSVVAATGTSTITVPEG